MCTCHFHGSLRPQQILESTFPNQCKLQTCKPSTTNSTDASLTPNSFHFHIPCVHQNLPRPITIYTHLPNHTSPLPIPTTRWFAPGTYDPEHGEDHHSKDQHAEVQRQENHGEVPHPHLRPREMWPRDMSREMWGFPEVEVPPKMDGS